MGKIKKKTAFFRKRVLPVVLVAALIITGSLAYFTSNHFKRTKYNYGNVDTELWELFDTDLDGSVAGYDNGAYNLDNYNDEVFGPEDDHPETIGYVLPNQTIIKAPWVKNTGNNDAYVYAEIGLPVQHQAVYDPITGEKVSDDAENVFQIVNSDGVVGQPNEGWTNLGRLERRDGFDYYLFSYDYKLSPGTETPHIFEALKYANVNSLLPYEDYNAGSAFPSELVVTDGEASKGFKTIYGEIFDFSNNTVNVNEDVDANELVASLFDRLYNAGTLSSVEDTGINHSSSDYFLFKISENPLSTEEIRNASLSFNSVAVTDVSNSLNSSYDNTAKVGEGLPGFSFEDYLNCLDENGNVLDSVKSKTVFDNLAEAFCATGYILSFPDIENASNVVYSSFEYTSSKYEEEGTLRGLKLTFDYCLPNTFSDTNSFEMYAGKGLNDYTWTNASNGCWGNDLRFPDSYKKEYPEDFFNYTPLDYYEVNSSNGYDNRSEILGQVWYDSLMISQTYNSNNGMKPFSFVVNSGYVTSLVGYTAIPVIEKNLDRLPFVCDEGDLDTEGTWGTLIRFMNRAYSVYTVYNVKTPTKITDLSIENATSLAEIFTNSSSSSSVNFRDYVIQPGVYFGFTILQPMTSFLSASFLLSLYAMNGKSLSEEELASIQKALTMNFPTQMKTADGTIIQMGYNVPINEYSIQTEGFENEDALTLFENCFNKKRYSSSDSDKATEEAATQDVNPTPVFKPHNQVLFDYTFDANDASDNILIDMHDIDFYYLEDWLKDAQSCGYAKINDEALSKWDFLESLYMQSDNVDYGPVFAWKNVTEIINESFNDGRTEILSFDERLVVEDDYITFTPYIEEVSDSYNDNVSERSGKFNLPWILNVQSSNEFFGESFDPGLYAFYYIDTDNVLHTYGYKIRICEKDTNYDDYDFFFNYNDFVNNIENYEEIVEGRKYKIADVPDGINNINDFADKLGYINKRQVNREDWKRIMEYADESSITQVDGEDILRFNKYGQTYDNDYLNTYLNFAVSADGSTRPFINGNKAQSVYDGINGEIISDEIVVYNKTAGTISMDGETHSVDELLSEFDSATMILSVVQTGENAITVFSDEGYTIGVISSTNGAAAENAIIDNALYTAAVNIINNNEGICHVIMLPSSNDEYVYYTLNRTERVFLSKLLSAFGEPGNVEIFNSAAYVEDMLKQKFIMLDSDNGLTYCMHIDEISLKVNYNTVIKKIDGDVISYKVERYNLGNNGLSSVNTVSPGDTAYADIESAFNNFVENGLGVVYKDSDNNNTILLRDNTVNIQNLVSNVDVGYVRYGEEFSLPSEFFGQKIIDGSPSYYGFLQSKRGGNDKTFDAKQGNGNDIIFYNSDDVYNIELISGDMYLTKNTDNSFTFSFYGHGNYLITADDSELYSVAETAWNRTPGINSTKTSYFIINHMESNENESREIYIMTNPHYTALLLMIYPDIMCESIGYEVAITPDSGNYNVALTAFGDELTSNNFSVLSESEAYSVVDNYYNNADYSYNGTAIFYAYADINGNVDCLCDSGDEAIVVSAATGMNVGPAVMPLTIAPDGNNYSINVSEETYIIENDTSSSDDYYDILDAYYNNYGDTIQLLGLDGNSMYVSNSDAVSVIEGLLNYMVSSGEMPADGAPQVKVYNGYIAYLEDFLAYSLGVQFTENNGVKSGQSFMGKYVEARYDTVIEKNGNTYTVKTYNLNDNSLINAVIYSSGDNGYENVVQSYNNYVYEHLGPTFTNGNKSYAYVGNYTARYSNDGDWQTIDSNYFITNDMLDEMITYGQLQTGIFLIKDYSGTDWSDTADVDFYLRKAN